MLETLFVCQFEISGKKDKEEQKENIYFISVTLFVFHLEISGKDIKLEQL